MTEGLRVEGFSIEYRTPRGPVRALRDVSLAVGSGRLLALVGESGSGKSTLAFAAAGWMAPNAAIRGGRVLLDGRPVGPADRGRRVAMVFQDPAAALNPSMRLGPQVAEVQMRHRGLDARAAAREAEALLARVRLPDPAAIAARYPHEVSGGEKQRTLIAMALAARPRLLVCDEPTTALDATTAVGILDLIAALRREEGLAVLYVTHDLGIAARVADLATVLYAGTVVESGVAATVLHAPAHPYTRLLLASIPNPHAAERHLPAPLPGAPPDLREPPPGCVFAPRCPLAAEICAAQPPLAGDERHSAACWRAEEARRLATPEGAQAAIGAAAAAPLLEVRDLVVTHGRPRLLDRLTGRARTVRAVAGVSLTIRAGETFGLIGESGCGKTSLLRTLAGLSPFAGTVALGGEAVRDGARFPHTWRRDIQLVFQHPDQSLNPRMRVGATLARPLVLHRGLSGGGLRREVMEWLERVRLPAHYAARWPHELSGGEKQRIAIARAFAAGPKLVLCDEVTSGLDVSVQAAVLDLLRRLQRATGVALLLVSHDLNMVQGIADRVAVMYLGRIMEARQLAGPFAPPMHPYSEALLAAAPVPDPAVAARPVRLEGPLPSPANPPPGCPFATRCPRRLGPVCDTPPPWRATRPEDGLLCHIPIEDLAAVPPIWRRAA
jgi:peptide/nickel transport system ATP-binding protein